MESSIENLCSSSMMESNEFRRPNRLWEASLSGGEAEMDVRPQTRVLNWARFRWSLHLLGNVGVIGYGGRYGLQEVVSRTLTITEKDVPAAEND